ncbi:MAG TPA: flagellar export chaperone FlgN [Baekduia sp.]|uniref:flagellar export chaperone FlgN n=1 Tax=Baekduia sp. TaxID=2600305 RepID=UPI002CD96F74|nr:flagellar export chaperone FlgN [Baekduia sp.]HMJ37271.1 flagellar export chaperone FlgN [Baekduia sp.]
MTLLAPPAAPTAFGTDVLRHLDAQIASARRLLDAVLRQGAAIRSRDVDGVLARLGEMQAEMERRAALERDRVRILTQAGGGLGVAPHTVTLDALAQLLSAHEAQAAKGRSAELRGLLAEVQREHVTNRALMRQELAFLSHLTRQLGVDGEDVGYRPPSEPGATMRATLDPAAQPVRMRRALDLEA